MTPTSEAAAIQARLDSLPHDEEHAIERIDLLNQLGWEMRVGDDWDALLKNAQEARELAESKQYEAGVAGALRNAAFGLYMKGNLAAALESAGDALHRFQTAAREDGVAESRAVLAFIHRSLGNYDRGLQEGLAALDYAQQHDEPWTVAWSHAVVGGIYESLRDGRAAAAHYERAYEHFVRAGHLLGQARSLTGLGVAYQDTGQPERAFECMEQSLALYRQISNRMGESRALNDLGHFYEQRGDQNRALELFRAGLRIREEDRLDQAASTSLLSLAGLHLRRREPAVALELLNRALAIAEQWGAKPKIYQAHQLLSETYEQLGSLAQALHHERAYHRVREGVFNEEASTRLRNLELTYQAEQKDREAELERLRNDVLEAKNAELARLVDELRATQSQLIQSEKMSSLGSLVAALAHEINSPLGAIRSSSDLVERCVDRILSAVDQAGNIEQLRASHALQTSTRALRDERRVSSAGMERISRIIGSLRSFSQLDQAAYSVLDIPRALEDILTLIESDLRARKIEVRRAFGDVPKLYAYVSEIHQVFMNLVQNSAETMDQGGRLMISTSSDGDNVKVCFEDTAPQVPPELRPRLFDPSISTHGERARGSMRMFTCLHIIRKHGGEISIEAGAPEGMRYTVQMPCRLADLPSPPFEAMQTLQ